MPRRNASSSARSRLPRTHHGSLRSNFWQVPLLMAGAGLVLAVLMVGLEDHLQRLNRHLPAAFQLTGDDAKALLTTLTGASMTVVALVVSLTMVVLSLVATNFGPRIIRNFVRRLTTQLVIGAFVATFVYSLVVLGSVFSDQDRAFVPVLSTWMAVLMVLGATVLLVWWVHDLSVSIQTSNALVGIAADLHDAVDVSRLVPDGTTPVTGEEPSFTAAQRLPTGQSGYIQRIDVAALVELARRNDIVIRVTKRAGAFVVADSAVAEVSAPVSAPLAASIVGQVRLGQHRTMDQDPEYAVHQFVEIGLRALSPAVNDPYTAVNCIDWISDALRVVTAAPIDVCGYRDRAGVLRVIVRPNSFRGVVDAGFEQLRQAGVEMPAIVIRLADAIANLAVMSDDHQRAALAHQFDGLVEAAEAQQYVRIDRADVDAALERARTALAVPRP